MTQFKLREIIDANSSHISDFFGQKKVTGLMITRIKHVQHEISKNEVILTRLRMKNPLPHGVIYLVGHQTNINYLINL